MDPTQSLINENTYYKTDTHINLFGNMIVLHLFLNKIKNKFKIEINFNLPKLKEKKCILNDLGSGIGDLTWESNGFKYKNLNLEDTFYYINEKTFYPFYQINENSKYKFINKKTMNFENLNSNLKWEILSQYIIYSKNPHKQNHKVIIFYDSFLCSVLDIYLSLFQEVYVIKENYNPKYIEQLKPNYVFEFRVERFLNIYLEK